MGFKSFYAIFFRRKVFITGFLLLGFLVSLQGLDLPIRKIEDDASLRLSIRTSWFIEAADRVLNMNAFVHTLPGGTRIQVRAEAGKDEFMIVLAREWNGTYPGWAQGSWVFTRRKDDGSARRIRVFLRSDPYTYIQFRPTAPDRCMMDVVVYDAYIVRSLPVPYSINRLLAIPVEEILSSVNNKFPKRYFDPDPEMYRDIRTFINQVRERLPELQFKDDGAIDDTGRYVYINTLEDQDQDPGLNCSGFAKWIVDGILRPFTGKRLPIPPLKQVFGDRGSSFTESYESLRDPFFGLDWTRNLAATANMTLFSPTFITLEDIEVQKRPFSLLILRNKSESLLQSYPDFFPNAGFSFEGIQPLLYTLAIDEPGNIYLASINNEMAPDPRMRQHFHVAVLIPYFNECGNFQVTVFESAEETSFTDFKNRYLHHSVNLVRIQVEPLFDP